MDPVRTLTPGSPHLVVGGREEEKGNTSRPQMKSISAVAEREPQSFGISEEGEDQVKLRG